MSGAPTLIWETLEHGEKIECLDCIAVVAPLLYDCEREEPGDRRLVAPSPHPRRLRAGRGVRADAPHPRRATRTPSRRSYAAYALGEFLSAPGVPACAHGARRPTATPGVRAAAAAALGRLNSDGGGALGRALSDADPTVRLAALGRRPARINSFSSAGRRRRAHDRPELRRPPPRHRGARRARRERTPGRGRDCGRPEGLRTRAFALSPATRWARSATPVRSTVLQNLAQNDPDTFVRDQATIAVQRL